ncbi:selenium-binding family protein [Actinomycetospora soli]|uniref:selenium-binding family protein n=1 Tax=Actinomycetospora soli TaxID=2893887 RepID=UPI001E4673E4|nr:selenium-binding family protein [Actinomycetospora soli]MCD2186770.1 selenium-binding family protein [Actinomycetospora soli]
MTASADIVPQRQTIQGSDGKDYWVENHVDPSALKASQDAARGIGTRPEYLVVWAGDENVADTAVPQVKKLPGSLAKPLDTVRNAAPGPDFMAVIDATKGSPTYGKVVNTATVGPLVENEPHHMQYAWHKGNKIFAGGLFTAATYVFDVSKLPALGLSGISLPTQTACGSVPDAYWVTKDGNAYGTYMGGPIAPGPCRYTNGEVRSGNGFAGAPGEVVRFDPTGKKIVEAPAATTTPEDPKQCLNLPALSNPTCANPHGIQVREDLRTMVTSDYAEPRTIILDPVKAPSPNLRRTTVRTWDISDPDHPEVRSVKYLPVGPRSGAEDPLHNENRAVMETTVTNQPGNKGAFAMTMQGGAIYYTADMTAKDPVWREVYDLTAAVKQIDPKADTGSGLNGGWLQTSPDDKTLYHAVMGRQPGSLGKDDKGTAGGVIALDISKLVGAGVNATCSIETTAQETDPGPGCPTLRSALPINPGETAGGPHWGALDNLELGQDGFYRETENPTRLSTANYFVARTGLDGDHRVCMVDIAKDGDMSLDRDFKDEVTGEPCVDFNRANWPHGPFGNAKPHSQLFVTADGDIK